MEMEWEKNLEKHVHDYIQNRCSVDKFVQEFLWCNNQLKTKFFHCRAYFIEALEPLHTPEFVQATLLMIDLFNRDGVCMTNDETGEVEGRENYDFTPFILNIFSAVQNVFERMPLDIPTEAFAPMEELCQRWIAEKKDTDPRLLLKFMHFFDIRKIPGQHVVDYIEHMMLPTEGHHALLVQLLVICKDDTSVEWPIRSYLEAFAETKEWNLAEKIVRHFESYQLLLIEIAIERQYFKGAVRFVNNFNFQDQFPDINEQYEEYTIDQICTKQLWFFASEKFVKKNKTLQLKLIARLMEREEYSFAQTFREEFRLQNETQDIPAHLIEQHLAASRNTYLQIEIEDIMWVNSEETLLQMQEELEQESFIGLDVEWKPVMNQTCASASLLQIGTFHKAYLLDLMKIAKKSFFNRIVGQIFCRKDLTKLGFQFDDDLKVLRKSFPQQTCFYNCVQLVELEKIFRKVHTGPSTKNIRSLKAITEHVLGKPLDKTMQCSNWERRPLLEAQQRYAALDAMSLCHLLQGLSKEYQNQGHEEYFTKEVKRMATGWDIEEITEQVQVLWWTKYAYQIHVPFHAEKDVNFHG